MTALVDRVEHEGVVTRRVHPTDRRVMLVEPTDQGQAPCTGSLPEGIIAVVDLFDVLSPADQRELLRRIQRLRQEVETRDVHDN